MRKSVGNWLVALGVLAAALLLRQLVDPWLHDALPLVTIFGAVAIAVGLAGWRPASLVAIAGYVSCSYLFIPPRGILGIDDSKDVLGVILYLVSTGAIIVLGERMRAAREQLQLVADSMPLAVTRCGRDLRYRWVSAEYARWLGRSEAEIVGRPIVEVLGRDVSERLHPHFQRVLAGQQVRYEDEIVFARRGRRWVDVVYTPTRDRWGEVDGWVAVVGDIDDRKRMEDRLRRKNERLALLSESAALLQSSDDPDLMLRKLFDKIAPHLGLDVFFNYMVDETGEALRLDSCIGIPDERVDAIRRLEFGEALCGRAARERQAIVASFIQQSGAPDTALARSFGLRAFVCNPLISGDRLIGTLSFASRSRDEFDLGELELIQTICHYVTAAYERVRFIGELRGADRRKDDFLATLAHELRNPLAPLRNMLEVMKRAPSDAATLDRCRETMDRQLGHVVRLVDDLLDVNRITRDKLELRRQRVELGSIVRQAVEASRPLPEFGGRTVDLKLPPDAIWIDADPVRLAQVFGNLLSNASKFSSAGSGIAVEAELANGGVTVTVKDEGIGIAPDRLGDIFDMFAQVDRSLERSQGGLGIGLTLVKRLVELHGGSVEARSAGIGMGSEFAVRLPAVSEVSRYAPSHAPVDRPVVPRRFLVVDDNRDSATSLALLLETAGHDAVVAYDGLEAVELARRCRPDVILLDIGLPGLNGYEVCRRVRQEPWGRAVLVVAFSGWGQDDDRRRSKDAGFDAHLVKPVAFADLADLLASHAVERSVS